MSDLLQLPRATLSEITTGDLTETTSSVLTITGGTGAVFGLGTTITVQRATTSLPGYLAAADFTTFNNKKDRPVIQYFAPTSGSSVTILATTSHLVLDPAANLAALTIVFPTGVDTKEISITCTKTITALTLTPAGSDIINSPLTAYATTAARWIYRATGTIWYRI